MVYRSPRFTFSSDEEYLFFDLLCIRNTMNELELFIIILLHSSSTVSRMSYTSSAITIQRDNALFLYETSIA